MRSRLCRGRFSTTLLDSAARGAAIARDIAFGVDLLGLCCVGFWSVGLWLGVCGVFRRRLIVTDRWWAPSGVIGLWGILFVVVGVVGVGVECEVVVGGRQWKYQALEMGK